MEHLEVKRLVSGDEATARAMFALMADVFEEGGETLGDEYVKDLLGLESFWAVVAIVDSEIVGGITAHTLPMTRASSSELFIYDLAIRSDHQRRGVGGALVRELRQAAARVGIQEVFVPADNDDVHALDFYRAQGGVPAQVTIFTFTH